MVLHDMYSDAPNRALDGTLGDVTTADVNVALLDDSHTKDLDANEVFDDLSADEISNTGSNDSGYTAGGETLTTASLSRSSTVTTFDADDVTWGSSTIDAGHAVVYEDTGDDTTASLITHVDFEGEQSSDNGDFTISWDSNGIFEFDTA